MAIRTGSFLGQSSAAPTGTTFAPTPAPSFAPTPNPTLQPSVTTTPAPTRVPTNAPTYHPVSRHLYLLGTVNNNRTCNIAYTPPALVNSGNLNLITEGPGSYCTGTACARYSIGAFAGAFCYGTQCAYNATGFAVGAACAGTQCAQKATGNLAGAFCYGSYCAQNAAGKWAGTHCIGNRCADGTTGTNAGECCVGLNCHNSTVTATSCANEADGGTPLNLGASSIFKYQCRRVIDTESAAWNTFYAGCAAGQQYAPSYSPNSACTITCSAQLSELLRFYRRREVDKTYADLRLSLNQRFQNYVGATHNPNPSSNKPLHITIYVLIVVLAVVTIAFTILILKHPIQELFHNWKVYSSTTLMDEY